MSRWDRINEVLLVTENGEMLGQLRTIRGSGGTLRPLGVLCNPFLFLKQHKHFYRSINIMRLYGFAKMTEDPSGKKSPLPESNQRQFDI